MRRSACVFHNLLGIKSLSTMLPATFPFVSSNKMKHTQQTNAKWFEQKKAKNEETKYEKTNRFKLGRSTFECNCYLWAAAPAAIRARPATIGSSTRGQCGSLCALSVCVFVCYYVGLVRFGFLGTRRHRPTKKHPHPQHTRDSCSVTLNSIGFCNDSFWAVRVLG